MKLRVFLGGGVIVAILAVTVYRVEYHVRELNAELAKTNRQILRNEEDINVLEAEWVYLNRPERLKELSMRYLNMKPPVYGQFAGVDAVPMKDTMLAEEPVAPKAKGIALLVAEKNDAGN